VAEFPSLVALINADPNVERVLHAGDIKAGKNSDCSDAYFGMIRGFFDTFDDPLVYTPGDNEWTDCHVEIKNNGLYTPTERLLAVAVRCPRAPSSSSKATRTSSWSTTRTLPPRPRDLPPKTSGRAVRSPDPRPRLRSQGRVTPAAPSRSTTASTVSSTSRSAPP
jgi:hypothetical protein